MGIIALITNKHHPLQGLRRQAQEIGKRGQAKGLWVHEVAAECSRESASKLLLVSSKQGVLWTLLLTKWHSLLSFCQQWPEHILNHLQTSNYKTAAVLVLQNNSLCCTNSLLLTSDDVGQAFAAAKIQPRHLSMMTTTQRAAFGVHAALHVQ